MTEPYPAPVPERLNHLGQPVGADLAGWAVPAWPDPPRLEGTYVSVERLAPRHADDLYDALVVAGEDPMWTYLSFGPFADRASFDELLRQLMDPSRVYCAILSPEGDAIGIASYLRIQPADGSLEVGGIVFSPRLQRTPAATEAMLLMADYAFGLGYRRYEWKCDSLHAGSRRAARRLGFVFEGVFRNATTYKGRSRDTAWYAITDDDWPVVREHITRWLEPANFDEDGRQRTALSAPRSDTPEPEGTP